MGSVPGGGTCLGHGFIPGPGAGPGLGESESNKSMLLSHMDPSVSPFLSPSKNTNENALGEGPKYP